MKRRLSSIMVTASIAILILVNSVSADLIAHWKFDDNAENTTVIDSSANANNVISHYNTSLMHTNSGPAHLGGGFSFNGSNDYVKCGSNADWQSLTASSVFMWVNASITPTGSHRYILYGGYWGAELLGDAIFMHTSNPEINIYMRDGTDSASAAFTIPDKKWCMVGYAWDGTNVNYYLNGTVIETDPYTGVVSRTSRDLYLGAYKYNSQFYDGSIDDVRLYDEGLTTTEVRQLYNDAIGNYPVAHWPLDDNAANTTVVDSSGTANNGIAPQNTSLMHIDSGPDNLGGAFQFDGNSGIDLGNCFSMRDVNASTVLMWIKNSNLGTGTNQYIYYGGYWKSPDYGDVFYQHTTLGDLVIGVRNASNVKTENIVLPDNEWCQVGYTWDGTNVKYYLDGQVTGVTDTFTGTLHRASAVNISLGKIPDSQYFNGAMDDVRVYNRALSSTEIFELYDAATPKGTVITVK